MDCARCAFCIRQAERAAAGRQVLSIVPPPEDGADGGMGLDPSAGLVTSKAETAAAAAVARL
eukprot:SAG22_NODE_609_length_8597_cov_12.875382_2_plen_62_part_00